MGGGNAPGGSGGSGGGAGTEFVFRREQMPAELNTQGEPEALEAQEQERRAQILAQEQRELVQNRERTANTRVEESRLAKARQRERILVPEKAVESRYANKRNTRLFMSEDKRARNYKTRSWGTLHRKHLNFQTVKRGERAYRESLQREQAAVERAGFLPEIFGARSTVPARYREAVAAYWDTDLTSAVMRDGETRVASKEQVFEEVVKRFLNLDLGVDVRNDEAFAANIQKVEAIIKRTDAFLYLFRQNPSYQESLKGTQEGRERLLALDGKMKRAITLSRYLKIQKRIITNPYYRKHYNSEIGVRYRENEEDRQAGTQELRMRNLLWMAEQYRLALSRDLSGEDLDRMIRDYAGLQNPEEEQYSQQMQEKYRQALSGRNTEGGISLHASYFRAHQRAGDPIHDGMTGEGALFPVDMEAFGRWTAVRNMTRRQVSRLVNRLTWRTDDPQNEDHVRQCREANLQGLMDMKDLLRRYATYLKSKYGDGLADASLEELARHADDLENDFADTGMWKNCISRLKAEGLFDEDDPGTAEELSDREMERLLNYYSDVREVQVQALDAFRQGKSYSDYRRMIHMGLAERIGDETLDVLLSQNAEMTVRWDTAYSEFAQEDQSARIDEYEQQQQFVEPEVQKQEEQVPEEEKERELTREDLKTITVDDLSSLIRSLRTKKIVDRLGDGDEKKIKKITKKRTRHLRWTKALLGLEDMEPQQLLMDIVNRSAAPEGEQAASVPEFDKVLGVRELSPGIRAIEDGQRRERILQAWETLRQEFRESAGLVREDERAVLAAQKMMASLTEQINNKELHLSPAVKNLLRSLREGIREVQKAHRARMEYLRKSAQEKSAKLREENHLNHRGELKRKRTEKKKKKHHTREGTPQNREVRQQAPEMSEQQIQSLTVTEIADLINRLSPEEVSERLGDTYDEDEIRDSKHLPWNKAVDGLENLASREVLGDMILRAARKKREGAAQDPEKEFEKILKLKKKETGLEKKTADIADAQKRAGAQQAWAELKTDLIGAADQVLLEDAAIQAGTEMVNELYARIHNKVKPAPAVKSLLRSLRQDIRRIMKDHREAIASICEVASQSANGFRREHIKG